MYEKRQLLLFKIITLFGMAFCCGLLFLTNISSWDIWADEACTLAEIKKGFIGMTYATAIDVHPPVYYYVSWFVCKIIGAVYNSIYAYIVTLRLFSLLYFLLCTYYLKKREVRFISITFFFFVLLAFEPMAHFTCEIRMYSLGLLLLLIVGVEAYRIMLCNDALQWGLFSFASLIAIHVHYFVSISVILIWIFLIINCSIVRKDRLVRLFVSGIGVSLLSIPWLVVLVGQIRTIKDNYWIKGMNANSLKDLFYYYLSYDVLKRRLLLLVLLVGIMCSFILIIKKEQLGIWTMFYIFFPLIIIGISFVIEQIYQPIFFDRYLIPMMGLCAWGVSMSIGGVVVSENALHNSLIFLLILGMIFVSLKNIYLTYGQEIEYCRNWNKLNSVIEESNIDTIIYNQSGNSLYRSLYVVFEEKKHISTLINQSDYSNYLFPNSTFEDKKRNNEYLMICGKGENIDNYNCCFGEYHLMYGDYELFSVGGDK